MNYLELMKAPKNTKYINSTFLSKGFHLVFYVSNLGTSALKKRFQEHGIQNISKFAFSSFEYKL
jgi:hypothetical protein